MALSTEGHHSQQGPCRTTCAPKKPDDATMVSSIRASRKAASQGCQPAPPPTRQSDLKPLVAAELVGAVFEAPLDDLPLVLPEPNSTHDEATKNVVAKWVTPFPKEKDAYQPIADVLNVAKPVTSEADPLFDARGFFVYDRTMHDCVEGAHQLKPDLLLLARGSDLTGNRARWRDVMVAGEVKADAQELVSQSATYARAMMDARKSRFLAIVLSFNQKTYEVRVLFFHRGGLLASPPLNVTLQRGQQAIARILCGIFMLEKALDAGWWPSSPPQFHSGEHHLDANLCSGSGQLRRNSHVGYGSVVQGRIK